MWGHRAVASIAALIGVAAVGGAFASQSVAARPAQAAKLTTQYLRVGDQVHVNGSALSCTVQSSSGVINFACVDGSLASPPAGTFAVGIADKGVDIARVTAGSAKLLKVIKEPHTAGATFTVPSRAPKNFTLSPKSALLIGGTHVFCALQTTDDAINFTCGLSSLAAKLQFAPGSYLTLESARFAIIGQVEPKGAFKTVVAKAQPKS